MVLTAWQSLGAEYPQGPLNKEVGLLGGLVDLWILGLVLDTDRTTSAGRSARIQLSYAIDGGYIWRGL